MEDQLKKSILIIDDENNNIITLQDILKSEYTVYASKNGRDTVKIAKENKPDVILLDIIMPETDGYEVFLKLQKDEETKNIPVIFVTGLGSNEDEKKGLDLGAADYISKPFNPAIVRLRVKKIIQMMELVEIAEQNSRYKTDFLAKMSHEIRTPMNAILGMNELAIREKKPEIKDKHLSIVKQSGANLLEIINNILDFSNIEKGKMEIKNSEYSFASLLDDLISITRMKAADSEVCCFTVKADSKIPQKLYGDENRIRQVVLNLLNNAIKNTKEGFVSFGVYGEFIDDTSINIIFEVEDSGRGIKPQDMDKLFDDFAQFDSETKSTDEGVGLGLPITKSIVSAMGGNITVKSEYGEGSIFTVTLPQQYSSRNPVAKVVEPENKKIIVFEQRKPNAESLAYTIENLGIKCTIVSSGTELYKKMEEEIFDYLFIPFKFYIKNEDTIIKFGQNIGIALLSEFGEAIPENYFNELIMPVYCTQIADIINGIHGNYHIHTNIESLVEFSAPDAKVLIVDDINTNLKVAEGFLLPYNIQVDLCNSGKSSIEAVKSNNYDLVFMDHRMPVMDGMEATKRIREWEKTLPIIALTANAVSGMTEMFLENGFNDFLSKPIDVLRLNNILEKWLPKEKIIKIKE